MYLTRLSLDPRSAQARRDLADAYDMHRTLVRAFVADAADTPPRFLWRLEASNAIACPAVLVQSVDAPQWAVLEGLPGYLRCPAETRRIALPQLLREEAQYRFRLCANPTVTRNGKRVGLASQDAQLAWLYRQGLRWGFAIDSAVVTSSVMLQSRKGAASIFVQRTAFDGILRATDITLLGTALEAGIGPGKAFGCGLLSLAAC